MKARKLKGFNDYFADDMKLREYVIGIFKNTFEKYGYEPLETPALEYTDLLLGQSGDEAEKQFYSFKDSGGRDVTMRYEVMIAMCRAVAEKIHSLPLPYKRYQIQRCWRAENTQRGRYREFTQCDADTVGSSSMMCDAEFIQMGLEIVEKLGFSKYIARISNRKFLEGFAEVQGVKPENFYGFCMSLDKLAKIGSAKVVEEMVKRRNVAPEVAEKTLEMLDPGKFAEKSFSETIEAVRLYVEGSEVGNEGLDELAQVGEYMESVNVDPSLFMFDVSLARGLAHYTGPVWEFEVIDGGVGSIAGCGRYDEAISKYVGEKIPATGGSFGIERVCDILKEREMIDLGDTTVEVLVTQFDGDMWKDSLSVADTLRKNGISVMLYPEPDSLKKQMKYADKKEIPYIIVIGPEEKEKGVIQLKDMRSGDQKEVEVDDVPLMMVLRQ